MSPGQESGRRLPHTPDDKQINFVKEEVFGITDGNPIISPDHPVMVEMFGLPIVGALF